MKKVVVLLVCAVVLLVGDKSGIELPSFGAKKDYEQGKAFYDNKAYEQGRSFYNNKEYDKAAELFKKACDGGDMDGCRNLGVMYEKGKVVEKD